MTGHNIVSLLPECLNRIIRFLSLEDIKSFREADEIIASKIDTQGRIWNERNPRVFRYLDFDGLRMMTKLDIKPSEFLVPKVIVIQEYFPYQPRHSFAWHTLILLETMIKSPETYNDHTVVIKIAIDMRTIHVHEVMHTLGQLIGVVREIALVFTDVQTVPCYNMRHDIITGVIIALRRNEFPILPAARTRLVINGFFCDKLVEDIVMMTRGLNTVLDHTSMFIPQRKGSPNCFQYCCKLTSNNCPPLSIDHASGYRNNWLEATSHHTRTGKPYSVGRNPWLYLDNSSSEDSD